jgi:hypothetical protein
VKRDEDMIKDDGRSSGHEILEEGRSRAAKARSTAAHWAERDGEADRMGSKFTREQP